MTRGIVRRPDLRVLSMLGILVSVWLLFRWQVGEFYFSGESIAKLSRDMVTWTILAAGMTLVIVSGNIDLSVGSLLALVAATGALLINGEYGPGLPAEIAVPVAIGVATIIGALQGALTAYIRIPSFIVTLGGLFIFRGVTQKVSAYDPRIPDSSWITSFGFGYLDPASGWILAAAVSVLIILFTIVGRQRRLRAGLPADAPWLFVSRIVLLPAAVLLFVAKVNEYKGVPLQTLILAGVLVSVWVIARHMTFGRRLYAIGGNSEAARLSGIRVEAHIVGVFALMGFLAGIAGTVWMAQNQGSTKNAGEFYELYAIAAAVIGGTSLMGGRGTVLGTFLGGLVMATVIQGMDYTNLENWLQLVVRGGLLVAAVGIDLATKNPPRRLIALWRRFQGRRFIGRRDR